MKTALFIGRFQPFHHGHLSVLQDLYQQGFAHVILGIGSSQFTRLQDNPLSLAERKQLIDTVLHQRQDVPRWTILSIPDIHDDAQWVAHVDDIIQQAGYSYDAIYTGNDWVRRLFEAAGKTVQPVKKVIPIDGTAIRQAIRSTTANWQPYVDTRIHPVVEQAVKQST